MLKIKLNPTFLLFAFLLSSIFLLNDMIFSKKAVFFWMWSKPQTLSSSIRSLSSYCKKINCKIESTDVAIKNQTASSSYKPALLDCGIKVDVPPFIESGDKIIIDTRSMEYVKKI